MTHTPPPARQRRAHPVQKTSDPKWRSGYCLLSAMVALLATLWSPTFSQALDPAAFQALQLPSPLVRQPPTPGRWPSGVLLVASSPGNQNGFPSFNAIHVAGPFPAQDHRTASLGEVLVESYQRAGFSSPSVVEIIDPEGDSAPIERDPLFVLSYENGPQAAISVVYLILEAEEHFVLTWTDFPEHKERLLSLAREVVSSLPLTEQTSTRESRLPSAETWIIVLAVLVGALILSILFLRHRATRND